MRNERGDRHAFRHAIFHAVYWYSPATSSTHPPARATQVDACAMCRNPTRSKHATTPMIDHPARSYEDPVIRDTERHEVRQRALQVSPERRVVPYHNIKLIDREEDRPNDQRDPNGLQEMRPIAEDGKRFTPGRPRRPELQHASRRLGQSANLPAAMLGSTRFSLDHSTSE